MGGKTFQIAVPSGLIEAYSPRRSTAEFEHRGLTVKASREPQFLGVWVTADAPAPLLVLAQALRRHGWRPTSSSTPLYGGVYQLTVMPPLGAFPLLPLREAVAQVAALIDVTFAPHLVDWDL